MSKIYNLQFTEEEMLALPIIKEMALTYTYDLYEKTKDDPYYKKHQENIKAIDNFQKEYQGICAVACNIVNKVKSIGK